MSVYTRKCMHCDVEFETSRHNRRLCSTTCQKARAAQKTGDYNRTYYYKNHEQQKARCLAKYHANSEEINQGRSEVVRKLGGDASREAKNLKPVLDAIEFTPDNLPRIARMVEYIESDQRLSYLLDWYWVADAIEYLQENNYDGW